MDYLFITNQFMMGGVEKVFLNIAAAVQNKKIYLLPLHRNYDTELLEQLPRNVILIKTEKHIVNETVIGVLNILRLAVFVNKLFANKRENLCCVNFSDTISTLFFSLLVKAKKHISWCHCSPFAFKNSRFFFLYKKLFCKFDLIVNLCDTQKNAFCEQFGYVLKNKIVVCPNIVDIKKIDLLKDENIAFKENFILTVARFDNRSKDFITLIDAYSSLKNDIGKTKLVLIGDGPDREVVFEYTKKCGLTDFVFFAGLQQNPYKWMSRAEVFVLSSKTEGFGMVIAEALACSCPVIASDCVAGPKDILQNKYGFLFEVGNTVQLTELLYGLLTDKKKSEWLRSVSKERVLQLNEEAVTMLEKILV